MGDTTINTDTKWHLNARLSQHFKFKDGESLGTVVSNVLNNQVIFTFLATFLQKGYGLELGKLTSKDDPFIHYGLTLDLDNVPRKTKLYSYEDILSLAQNNGFRMISGFPKHSNIKNYSLPTPEKFLMDVTRVLQEPNKYVSDISKFLNKKK